MRSGLAVLMILTFMPALASGVSTSLIDDPYQLETSMDLTVRVTNQTGFNGTINLSSPAQFIELPNDVGFSEAQFNSIDGENTTNITADLDASRTGNFTINLSVLNANGEVVAENQQQTKVYDSQVPPVVKDARLKTQNGTRALQISTSQRSLCRLDFEDKTYDNLRYEFYNRSSDGKTHTFVFNRIEPRNYQIYIRCQNENTGVTMNTSFLYEFEEDITPPNIIDYSPTSVTTKKPFETTVITDEQAICKYSAADDSFASMQEIFENDYTTSHTSTLPGDAGTEQYYVRCKDRFGNAMNESEVLRYDQAEPPTADITLATSGRLLSQGYYDVELETSTELLSTPSLSFNYIDRAKTTDIPLTKEDDQEYQGTLYINEEAFTGVGTFEFSGESTKGVKGTEIEDGGTYKIITQQPQPVTGVSVETQPDQAKLRWNHKQDEIFKNYVIRRYDRSEPSADSVFATDQKHYTDTQVAPNQSYEYEIIAVNQADLTSQPTERLTAITPVGEQPVERQPGKTSQSSSSSTTNQDDAAGVPFYLQNQVDAVTSDINSTRQRLKESESVPSERFPQIKNENDEILSSFQRLDTNLSDLPNESVAKQTLETIRTKLKEAENNFVKKVETIDNIQKTTSPGPAERERVVDQYIDGSRLNMTEAERSELKEDLLAFSTGFETKRQITSLRKSYAADTVDNLLRVTKTVIPREQLETNITIYELLGDSISSEVVPVTSGLRKRENLLVSDTIDAAATQSSNATIRYNIADSENLEKLQASATVALPANLQSYRDAQSFSLSIPSLPWFDIGFYVVALSGFLYTLSVAFPNLRDDIMSVSLQSLSSDTLSDQPGSSSQNSLDSDNQTRSETNNNNREPKKTNQRKSPRAMHAATPPHESRQGTAPSSNITQADRIEKALSAYKAPPQHPFHLRNGTTIQSLHDLYEAIHWIPMHTFTAHANAGHFATWIEDVFELDDLARTLQYINDKDLFIDALEVFAEMHYE